VQKNRIKKEEERMTENNAILVNTASGAVKFAHNGSVQIFADGRTNMKGCIAISGLRYNSETGDDPITVEEQTFNGVTKVTRGTDTSFEIDTSLGNHTIRVWAAQKKVFSPREPSPVRDTTWTDVMVT